VNAVQTKRKLITPFLIAVFIMPLLVQGIVPASANITSTPDDEWRTIKTDVITIFFPAGGKKPMFLWWYNREPENIYVVKFDGLTEYFTFETPYYSHMFDASDLTFKKLFEDFAEEIQKDNGVGLRRYLFQLEQGTQLYRLREQLSGLAGVIGNITKAWGTQGHPHYFPFSEAKWTLQDVTNITADDDQIIGLTFTFNLTKVYKWAFKFAENNIAIRIRFYNNAVTEDVKAPNGTVVYSYMVGANEMKMDFIVKDWKWNLDLVEPFLQGLRDYGVNVPQTKTGLALGIHLASINKTALDDGVDDEEVEACANTKRMIIENNAVGLGKIDDDETPLEIAKGLKDYFKLKFASDNQTLAGFFKFIASAMVTNSSGSYEVPVKAAYRAHGASLRLFIGYPYFNGTLVHDPSIGVETPETTASSATTPSYRVTVGSTSAAVTAQLIAPQILSMQLIILLVVVATAIALVLLLARSRGRAVVLRSI